VLLDVGRCDGTVPHGVLQQGLAERLDAQGVEGVLADVGAILTGRPSTSISNSSSPCSTIISSTDVLRSFCLASAALAVIFASTQFFTVRRRLVMAGGVTGLAFLMAALTVGFGGDFRFTGVRRRVVMLFSS
jgi:hypothetical protein